MLLDEFLFQLKILKTVKLFLQSNQILQHKKNVQFDEKNNNPRLQVANVEEYTKIMNNLKLENPKMMDIAVPANVKGLTLDQMN